MQKSKRQKLLVMLRFVPLAIMACLIAVLAFSGRQLTAQQITPQLQLLIEFIINGHLQVLVYCYEHNSPLSPLDFWLKLRSFIDQPALLAAMTAKSDKSP